MTITLSSEKQVMISAMVLTFRSSFNLGSFIVTLHFALCFPSMCFSLHTYPASAVFSPANQLFSCSSVTSPYSVHLSFSTYLYTCSSFPCQFSQYLGPVFSSVFAVLMASGVSLAFTKVAF